jgi:hypothetical protein
MLFVLDPLPDGHFTHQTTLAYSVQNHCSFVSLFEGMIGAIHVHVSLEKKVCSSANLKETNLNSTKVNRSPQSQPIHVSKKDLNRLIELLPSRFASTDL